MIRKIFSGEIRIEKPSASLTACERVFSWIDDMRLEWETDDNATRTIRRAGLKWVPKTVSVAEIDVKTSRHNHARKQAIIDANVDDYADAMSQGDVFPKIVLAKIDGGSKFIVAGGNHRLAAAIKIGVTEIDVMVVECSSAMFSLLCPALNLYVGQREDRSVRVSQAADAVVRLGISQKQAAQEYKVPVASVSHAVAEARVIVSAARLGIKADTLPTSYLRVIVPVESDATLLPLAIELSKTKLNTEEVRRVVSEARKLPTEADRVAMLKEKIEDAKKITLSGRIPTQPTRSKVMRCVTTLENTIIKGMTLSSLQITRSEALEIARKLEQMATSLLDAK
jgi:hypothetical protein